MAVVQTNTAINATAGKLKEGDTLEVLAGVYDECHINDIPSNCRIVAVGGPVWIRPSAGDACIWLNHMQSHIEFDGINLDATNLVNCAMKIEGWSVAQGNPHHITFKNAEIIGCKNVSTIAVLFVAIEPGIIGGNQLINVKIHGGGIYDCDHCLYIQSGDNLVEGCEMYDFAGAGVQFYNGYGVGQVGNVLRSTTIRDARPGCIGNTGYAGRHAGIYAYSQDGLRIEGCRVLNIPNNGGGTTGIEVSSYNTIIDGCTVNNVQGTGVAGLSGEGNVCRNSDLRGNEIAISGAIASENNLTEGAPGAIDPPPIDPPPVEPPRGMPSADGTTIPPATEITDNHGNVWTMNGQAVMLNGTDSGGAGTQLLFFGGAMYTLGTDGQWWTFQYDYGWVAHGGDPRGGELGEGYEQEGEAGSKPPVG